MQTAIKNKSNRIAYILIAPTLVMFAWLLVKPLAHVFLLSFQHKILTRPKLDAFIGLKNFHVMIFEDPVFWKALSNSAKWVVAEVSLQLIFGLAVALFLQKKFKGCGFARAIAFLPWALSGVLVSMLWSMMYFENVGVINDLLQKIGVIKRPIAWTGNLNTAFWSIIIAELWRGIPFFSIMLLASIQSIPHELYEACKVDGGNSYQSFRFITLPSIKDTIVITTLLRAVWEFNSVDLILNLTGGGPIYETTTLAVYLANTARKDGDFGYGSAISVVAFLILLLFCVVYLRLNDFTKETDL